MVRPDRIQYDAAVVREVVSQLHTNLSTHIGTLNTELVADGDTLVLDYPGDKPIEPREESRLDERILPKFNAGVWVRITENADAGLLSGDGEGRALHTMEVNTWVDVQDSRPDSTVGSAASGYTQAMYLARAVDSTIRSHVPTSFGAGIISVTKVGGGRIPSPTTSIPSVHVIRDTYEVLQAVRTGFPDVMSLQEQIQHLEDNGGYLELSKDYEITESLVLANASNFTIDGNGYTIKMADGEPANSGHRIFLLWGCSNFTIKNITLDANATNRPDDSGGDPHNVYIGGCSNFTFRNVTAKDSPKDNFYISYSTGPLTGTSDGRFQNIVCDTAVRGNFVIIKGTEIRVDGGKMSGAGSSEIDIEPNSYALANFAAPVVSRVSFRNLVLEGQVQLSVSDGDDDTLDDIEVSGCTSTRGVTVACNHARIVNNSFRDCTSPVDQAVVRVQAYGQRCQIVGNSFRDINVADTSCISIVDSSQRMQEILVEGNQFVDVERAVWAQGPNVSVVNNAVYGAADPDFCIQVENNSLVSGNVIKDSTKCAILVTGANTTVSDNQIENCDQTVAGYGAIRAESPCNIVDNQVINYQIAASAVVSAGGTGYAVDDRLTVGGGTADTAATFKVTAISGGGATGPVTTVSLLRQGAYTVLPANPAATTNDGSGDDACTLTITWTDHTDTTNGVGINSTGDYNNIARNFVRGFSTTAATAITKGGNPVAVADSDGNVVV